MFLFANSRLDFSIFYLYQSYTIWIHGFFQKKYSNLQWWNFSRNFIHYSNLCLSANCQSNYSKLFSANTHPNSDEINSIELQFLAIASSVYASSSWSPRLHIWRLLKCPHYVEFGTLGIGVAIEVDGEDLAWFRTDQVIMSRILDSI